MKQNNKKGLLLTAAAVLHSICTLKGLMWPKDPGFKQGADTEGAQGRDRKQKELSPSPGIEVLKTNRRNIKGATTQGKNNPKIRNSSLNGITATKPGNFAEDTSINTEHLKPRDMPFSLAASCCAMI